MRGMVLFSFATLTAAGFVAGPNAALAQSAPPAQAQPKAAAPAVANRGEVVATVEYNGVTENITKGDVLNIVTRYQIPAVDNQEQVYHDAVDTLANTKLVTQFLNRQPINITPDKIDAEMANLEQGLKAEGKDLASALLENGYSLDDIKNEVRDRLRWVEYVKAKATDAELKRFVAENNDLFSGTQVRASHILLMTEPGASDVEKQKIKAKLAEIKKQIDSNQISFADAANKYSEDPANEKGGGGDLDFFDLRSGFIPEFTDVAFKLKKGQVSDPVETPYGYHLIQVTDRKEGRPFDLEQNKPLVINAYAAELQKNLLTEARKAAKITVKPMPKDLFPPVPAAAAAPAPAPAPAGEAKAK